MAQDIDYSKLSDEELEKLAGGPAEQAPSEIDNIQFEDIAEGSQENPDVVEIPPLVAGGATAATLFECTRRQTGRTKAKANVH